jgi:hypothetical protein
MADIYRAACFVIAWIGDYGDLGKARVHTIFEQIERTAKAFTSKMLMKDAAKELELANLDDRAAVKYAFLNLLERLWFSRKSVVQEVASSPRDSCIMCGHDSALFSELKIFWEVVKRNIEGQPWVQWDQSHIDNIFSVTLWAQSRHSQSRNITKLRTLANDLLVLFKSFINPTTPSLKTLGMFGLSPIIFFCYYKKQAPSTRRSS